MSAQPIERGDVGLVVGRLGAGGYFIGNIDEVNVMNHAATDAEVTTLFRGWRYGKVDGLWFESCGRRPVTRP